MRAYLVLALAIGCGGSPGGGGDVDARDERDAAVDAPGTTGDGGPDDGMTADAPVDGPPVPLCPAGQWCGEQAPIAGTTLLYGVHALDANDVFAVGNGGTILRRKNGSWSAMTSGTTSNLRGVWAANANDAWAVGENGTALHWNGTSWSQFPGAATNVTYSGVWGAGPSDVWLIGSARAQHWNGTSWSSNTITGGLLDISGTSGSDVWVTGEQTYVRHYTGSWTTVMPPSGGVSYYAIEARAANDVWVSTPAQGTMRYTGAGWTSHATGSAIFGAIYAAAANDAWGVAQTTVGHWDGSTWTLATPPGLSSLLWGVTGAAGHVWVVGSNATILHRQQ